MKTKLEKQNFTLKQTCIFALLFLFILPPVIVLAGDNSGKGSSSKSTLSKITSTISSAFSSSSSGTSDDDYCNDYDFDETDECCHCRKTADCGNGTIESGEFCDDRNETDGDGCTGLCKEEKCGDGLVNNNSTEQCDDGNTTDLDGCSGTCKKEYICGNSLPETGEECEDGNLTNGDGCNDKCVLEKCGDTKVNNAGTEQCDDGNTANSDGCSSTCQNEGNCGNGITDGVEECDDGNTTALDGCDSACELETCGDNTLNNTKSPGNQGGGGFPEQCDDGNNSNGDGCSSTCVTEVICGNSNVDSGEQCDHGSANNGTPTDSCDGNCQLVQLALTCDAPQAEANSQFTASCHVDPAVPVNWTASSITPAICTIATSGSSPASSFSATVNATIDAVAGDVCKIRVAATATTSPDGHIINPASQDVELTVIA